MGRQPCCDKVGLKRGPWTIEEDHKLMSFILNNGIHCWRAVPKLAGLLRCGKSCRLRWINYLRPDLKRGAFTEMEENQIIQLHSRLGNRWSKIASHFPGRTDNEIKNHWNTRIKKKLKLLGLDPVTHQPIVDDQQDHHHHNQINSTVIEDQASPFKEAEDREEEEIPSDNAQMDTQEQVASLSRAHHCRQEQSQEQLKLDEATEFLLNDYGLLSESLDDEGLILQGTNQECNTSSVLSQSSMEDSSHNQSANSNYGEYINAQQQWVDSSVDSILSWDGFDFLDQQLNFLL